MHSNESLTDTCPTVLIADDGYSTGNRPGLRSGSSAALTRHDVTVGFASVARGQPLRDQAAGAGIAALAVIDVDLGPGDHVLPRARVDALRQGTLVVTATGHGTDVPAVRRRALAAEIGWATDIPDHDTPATVTWEHTNIVASPGIAGRTQHAVDSIAAVLADNIVRVLGGNPPITWDHRPPPTPRTGDQPRALAP